MKKVIFFDGDGTLWEPISDKYSEPWHIYQDLGANPFTHCRPTAKSLETLKAVGKKGIKRVLLSTSPLPSKQAIQHRMKIVESMGLKGLIDDIQVSPDYPEGKSEKITELLKLYKIDKKDALMVGDMYKWDYKPAKDVGVDALLLEKKYSYKHYEKNSSIVTISQIQDVLDYLK